MVEEEKKKKIMEDMEFDDVVVSKLLKWIYIKMTFFQNITWKHVTLPVLVTHDDQELKVLHVWLS